MASFKGTLVILHVAGLDKFIPPFVNFVYEEFDESHHFWLVGSIEKHPLTLRDGIYICGRGFVNRLKGYTKLIFQLHAAKKVIIHGLFSRSIELILALFPWLLPKCYWVIWGNDLYRYQNPRIGFKSNFNEAIRKFVIKRIGHLVTYIPGDVALARKWYGAQGQHHECLMYLSNLVSPQALESSTTTNVLERSLSILVGNSADPSNNHIEVLEKLLPYKSKNIKIYVPLSYGNKSHAVNVSKQGHEWFGEKFIPLNNFMPFDNYLDLLKNIDIAFFNHERQQGMGNTITLLGLGKSVYMRHDVSQWSFLTGLGIKINSITDFNVDSLTPLTENERKNNINLVQSYFSKEKLIVQLSNIFRS